MLALLDDVVGLTKAAAASLDDVSAQAAHAGGKALGVVIDDAAVTPRYVTGLSPARELPIVWRIAVGSARNKLLYLLPAALLLSAFALWSVTPLLMLGGAYLCYEAAEKIWHALRPHGTGTHGAGTHGAAAREAAAGPAPADPARLEEERVRGAIKTDFILSAEIMALTLATLEGGSTVMRAAILAVVGLGITVLVYGAVALIVKADDAGLSLAANDRPASTLLGLRRRAAGAAPAGGADRALRPLTQGIGRGVVLGMPHFLHLLGIVGTAAMLWVGGGILLHGLEAFGATGPAHLVHDLAHAAGAALPAVAGAVSWLVSAGLSGLLGLAVGIVLIPLVQHVLAPAARQLGALRGGRPAAAPEGHGGRAAAPPPHEA
nr:DUF808 domain-containing protein [Roseomonas acroporae]